MAIQGYPYIQKEPTLENIYGRSWTSQLKDSFKEWEKKAAEGSSTARINLNYYSEGGAGYADAYRDFLLRESAPIAKKLGVTTAQLVTNPVLATSAEELAKYTGKSVAEATKKLSTIEVGSGAPAPAPTLDNPGASIVHNQSPTTTGTVKYKSPTGTIFEAPAGSEEARNFENQGYTKVEGEEKEIATPSAKIPFKEGFTGDKASIERLIKTKRSFSDLDAKNYAYATGESDWKQFVGKTGEEILGTTFDYPTFYRDPSTKDIYNAKTGEKISSTEWEKDWSGRANEITAPTQIGTPSEGEVVEKDFQSGYDELAEIIADQVGSGDASDTSILDALNNLKEGQIDPYYKQLINQAQKDITTTINRNYEDRIRQLQTESYNLAENISNTQKNLEAQGMTFSGEAIKQLGTLSAFSAARPESLTPAQLGEEGGTEMGVAGLGMSPEQAAIEGAIPIQNRLITETSRADFNRGLENIGTAATRYLGTEGVKDLGLPTQALTDPATIGTLQYDYANTLMDKEQQLTAQADEKQAIQSSLTTAEDLYK